MSNSLSNLHQSLAGKDIGEEGANIVTRLLMQQIENTEKRFQPQNLVWESDVVSALRLCIGVGEGSKTAQAYVLALIRKHWDDLSLEFRKGYNYQYEVLVVRETGVQPSTMDNYTRTAETFFIKKKRPMGTVKVPVYTEYKEPLKIEGEIVTKEVEFDATKVPITKLNLVRPLAEQDKMTPKLWSMLMDKEVTGEAIRKEMYSGGNSSNTVVSDPSLKFRLEGNRIVVTEFGDPPIEIAEIYWDQGDSELGRTAIRRMLLALQIPFEEDQIARQIQEARNTMILRIYENGGKELIHGDTDD